MPINNIQSPEGNNNVASIKKLYSDREYYYNTILNLVSVINDNVYYSDLYNETALYGVVDQELDVILPKKEFLTSVMSANKDSQKMIDFAADAFNSFRNYLNEGVTFGKLSNAGPFYNIKVHRSYFDQQVLIDSAISLMSDNFKSLMLSRIDLNYKIRDHVTFNNQYLAYITDMIINKSYAVTNIGLTLSNLFITNNNGLTIDILQNSKCDNDTYKYDFFLNGPDFLPFKDACKRFGFLIDKNVPWKLTLDLLSPAMHDIGGHKGYMSNKNLNNIQQVFSTRYDKVYLTELEHLKHYFYTSYAYYMKNNKLYEKDYSMLAGNAIKNRKLYKRDVLTKEKYLQFFNDEYWLRMFVYLRNYENISGLTQQKFENIVRESNNYLKINKHAEALKFANSFFKDYNTVGYINRLQTRVRDIKSNSVYRLPIIIF